MAKRHIAEVDQSLRHFARHSSKCRHLESEGCNYPKRDLDPEKEKPDYRKITGFRTERHHIIPTGCLNRFEVWPAYRGYISAIHAIYSRTAWCSSRNKNMIALFVDFDAAKRAKLPLHNLHHSGVGAYNDQVILALHMRVWIKAKEVKDNRDCAQEKADEVKGVLVRMENEYRNKLHERGKQASRSMVEEVLPPEELVRRLKLRENHFATEKITSENDLWGKGVSDD